MLPSGKPSGRAAAATQISTLYSLPSTVSSLINALAQDWMEHRLGKMIRRTLEGVVGEEGGRLCFGHADKDVMGQTVVV
jgi:hypothetical protein